MNAADKQFNNRSVLVTGAGGGIGSEICRKLAAQSATIIATDINADALHAMIGSLPDSSKHKAIVGDISDAEFCNSLPGLAQSHAGSLDVIVNNAGIIRRGNIVATSDEDWQLSMSINVDAIFRICRAAIPLMKQQTTKTHDLRGAIVNLASCWGIYPGPEHLAYCTSKAAVAAMTKCLARDHAGDGIRVNAVCPNEVNTPMLRTGFEIRGLDADTAIQTLNETVPLGRIAEAEDIADTVLFLASDQARYVCGALLEVNGAKPVY